MHNTHTHSFDLHETIMKRSVHQQAVLGLGDLNKFKYHNIFDHSFIICSCLHLTAGERRSAPWPSRQSITGLTHREKQQFTLTFTPKGNLEQLISLNFACLLTVGGRQSTRREPTQNRYLYSVICRHEYCNFHKIITQRSPVM